MSNPSLYVPQQMWTYLRTQWRRTFGLNASQIEPLLFVGGQFRAEQWSALHQLGVRAVLSLQEEAEDHFVGPPSPRVLRLLVPDFHAPSLEQLREAVDFISAAHRDELPVFIHCHAGVGRAPLTAAAYLIATRQLATHTALLYIKRQRPIIDVSNNQLDRLLEWEASLQA